MFRLSLQSFVVSMVSSLETKDCKNCKGERTADFVAGLFFILPTSMGNVHGRTLLLLLTLVVTAVFTYAPFSTLIWYRQGVPHHVNITHEHRVVCPAWLNQSEMLEYADETMDTTQVNL